MMNNAVKVWNDLYSKVLNEGQVISPRGRKTLEINNVQYSMEWNEHFDPRVGRNISLDYIFREFLWFNLGNRYDTRMTKYAPLWESCISPIDGGINSNYGQYLFSSNPGFDNPFFHALNYIIEDLDSRRCWIPIFQEYMYDNDQIELPCTTGMGFRLINNKLHMNVHMRSQDLWHGAANDNAVCYLLQLMAVSFLNWCLWIRDIQITPGTITHYIDSLHLYKRHWEKACETVNNDNVNQNIIDFTELIKDGFSSDDILFLRRITTSSPKSDLLNTILNIPGDYGINEGVI